MKRAQFIRWVNYQKTLMAVYWLACDDGLRCYASTAEIAAETGLSAPTIRKHLASLKKNRVALRARVADRPEGRALVLLDHPDALRYLERNLEYWGPLSLQAELNRERQEARTERDATMESTRAGDDPGSAAAATPPESEPGQPA